MWSRADLDDTDGTLTEQVTALVVRMIDRGELAVGSRLPPERRLATSLGVSRVTVVRALDQLRVAGVVDTVHGSGTRVRPVDRLVDPVATAATIRRESGAAVIDLRFATTAAPQEVAEAYARVGATALGEAMSGDGPPPGGSAAVRTVLAEHLGRSGLPTDPTQLVVTTGAAAALETVLAGLDPGPGVVIAETPTYPAALEIFRRRRLEVIGWPAGAGGWDPDQLQQLCRRYRPQVVYLQSDNHNPTGASLPADRRPDVLATLRRAGALVISDETLRPLWLSADPQPPPLSAHPSVIGLGSLSKTVWGGLRVGWIRSSRSIGRRLLAAAPRALISPGALDDALAVELADQLDAIARRRRGLLRANLAGLESALGDVAGVAWAPPDGGMTLWLELLDARPRVVIEKARAAGLLISNGETFTVGRGAGRHVRISYTAGSGALHEAVARLLTVLTD